MNIFLNIIAAVLWTNEWWSNYGAYRRLWRCKWSSCTVDFGRIWVKTMRWKTFTVSTRRLYWADCERWHERQSITVTLYTNRFILRLLPHTLQNNYCTLPVQHKAMFRIQMESIIPWRESRICHQSNLCQCQTTTGTNPVLSATSYRPKCVWWQILFPSAEIAWILTSAQERKQDLMALTCWETLSILFSLSQTTLSTIVKC